MSAKPTSNLTTYFCKRYYSTGLIKYSQRTGKPYRSREGYWEGLGVVHAADSSDAWAKVRARFGKIDSVYPLDYCD